VLLWTKSGGLTKVLDSAAVLDWVKIGHLLAVFSWMAGLFYLPRLLVYHATHETPAEAIALFKVMERRLLKAIMRPAMIASWVFGIWLGVGFGWFSGGAYWLWWKVLAVGGLTAVHGLLERHVAVFARDEGYQSSKYFRVLNEVPTVLLMAIVILVVLKPF